MPREHEAEFESRIEAIPGCRMTRGGCDPEPRISCSGDQVTQATLFELISVIRHVKGENAEIKGLTIYETPLAELDLSPFLKAHFNSLSITHNALLTHIKGPPLDEVIEKGQRIYAGNIDISFNPLMSDEGLGDTLKYFEPNSVHGLNLWGNNLQGSVRNAVNLGAKDTDDAPEFLPGLALMKQLGSLEFAMNKISRIGGGQFRQNNKLSFLNFSQNPIKEIGSNAFLFDPIDPSDSYWKIHYKTLVIRLSDSELQSNAFVHGKIEWTNQRPIHLQIFNNQLDTLEPAIFENLLNANPENEIIASSNPLLDEKMKWLAENKEKYEGRVDFGGFKN